MTRRTLLLPLGVSGFLAGLLGIGFLYSVYETIVTTSGSSADLWALGSCGSAVWVAWTGIFYRLAREPFGTDVISRQCRLLLRGSILELLVAVPTHILARSRHYCCAGFMTFVGIVFGIAVMLMSFGPGVYFLFVERWKRLHPPWDAGTTPTTGGTA